MSPTAIDHLIGASEIADLRRPTGEASGLPGRAYGDPEFYRLEQDRLFPRNWMAAAYGSDLPEPGDAVPVAIAGFELLLVRRSDRSIGCFHNICRHRGMKLVGETLHGQTRLACRWHCWTYDLEGGLVATPLLGGPKSHADDHFEPEELGLKAISCGEWMNVVFVNIDRNAAPLEHHLRPLLARLGGHDLTRIAFGGITTESFRDGNWKLVIEGGAENYHLPWVHPQLKPSQQFATDSAPGCYVSTTTRRPLDEAKQRYDPADRPALPLFPGYRDASEAESILFFVVPTLVLAVLPNHVMAAIYVPLSHERTLVRRAFHFIDGGATDAGFEASRRHTAEFWESVGDQDGPYVREVQAMSRQRDRAGIRTRFSPFWETAVHDFQRYVLDSVLA